MDLSPSREAGSNISFYEFADIRGRIDRRLSELLPEDPHQRDTVSLASREAVLAGGKRVRPVLLVLAARNLGCKSLALVDLGCAVEMIHTASLILDDLPCMDDARLRRGRITTHRRFGEDVAILAAIALLTKAFSVVASAEDISHVGRTQMTGQLANTVGMQGLVKGQFEDLHEGGPRRSATAVCSTNTLKTGMLFEAPLAMAAIAADAQEPARSALRRFALELGQAFQLFDDLTDNSAGHGKDLGKDRDKTTLVALLGAEQVRHRFTTHLARADRYLTEVYGPENMISQFMHGLFARQCEELNVQVGPAAH